MGRGKTFPDTWSGLRNYRCLSVGFLRSGLGKGLGFFLIAVMFRYG